VLRIRSARLLLHPRWRSLGRCGRGIAGSYHGSVDALEVVQVGKLDHDPTSRAAHLDHDPRIEMVGQKLLQLNERGRPRTGRPGWGSSRGTRVVTLAGSNGLLDRPDRKTFRHCPLGQRLLEGPVRGSKQRPGVTGVELALGQQPLHRWGELE
jgi:hypothetical protein